MPIFIACMAILGIYLNKEVWPKIPKSYYKYLVLLMSIVLMFLFIILKLPMSINTFSIFLFSLISFGMFTFFKSR
ncbi:hypothetical protein IGI80_002904 [Enterococcus sp. DIV1420a]